MDKSTYIIAEAGVNHNGELTLAKQLVEEAARAGVDAVKFQTFKAASLVTRDAQKAAYQKKYTGADESQYQMLKRLELEYSHHYELMTLAQDAGIDFLSTAFDSESLRFLVHDLGLKTLKIPSGEMTNGPLVLEHARCGCELIISTGMATLREVEEILGVVAFGLIESPAKEPGREAFSRAFQSPEGQHALHEKVSLLHCTTEYPAPFEEINLRAMQTLVNHFGLSTGYSDHSQGVEIPIAAVAQGAVIIEKHFTLDRRMEGPDHKASLEPGELIQMVKSIRNVEKALGSGIKAPRISEKKNMNVARKSLVTTSTVEQGEIFTVENMSPMRPGNGVSPMLYWQYLGQKATRGYVAGELIDG